MFLVIDCETNGLPRRRGSIYADVDNWPRAVQVAWRLYDDGRSLVSAASHIVRPNGWAIPSSAAAVHGITTERAIAEGSDIMGILSELSAAASRAKVVVAHNAEFDGSVLAAEYLRANLRPPFVPSAMICTMQSSTDYCRLPGGPYGQYKWPTLQQLNSALGGGQLAGAHDAQVDAAACAFCFFKLVDRRVIRLRTSWWQRLFGNRTVVQPSIAARQYPAPRPARELVETRVISGSGLEFSVAVSGTAARYKTDESWAMGAMPGYDPATHGALPFSLDRVPLLHARMTENGRLVSDMTTAYVAGPNREILIQHACSLQTMLERAAQLAGGFHRGFVFDPNRIPDLPVVPPRVEASEILAHPATLSIAPLTKTGKVPKFPLSASFSIAPDVVVRPDGLFVHVVGSGGDKGDSAIVHLGYMSDGTVGKASIHCWRSSTRWSVDCVMQNGGLMVARVERGKADGSTERRYDYKNQTTGLA